MLTKAVCSFKNSLKKITVDSHENYLDSEKLKESGQEMAWAKKETDKLNMHTQGLLQFQIE